jgi:hypothetical protein
MPDGGGDHMPFEAIVVTTAVVVAFITLALTLFWAERRTSR